MSVNNWYPAAIPGSVEATAGFPRTSGAALFSRTASLDAAVVLAGRAVVANIDASVKAVRTAATSLNAALQTGRVATTTIDGIVRSARSAVTSLESAIQAGKSATASLDANVFGGTQLAVQFDAAVNAAVSAVASLESAIQIADLSISLGIDAWIATQSSGGLAASLDAILATLKTASVAIDVAIRYARQARPRVDAYIFDANSARRLAKVFRASPERTLRASKQGTFRPAKPKTLRPN